MHCSQVSNLKLIVVDNVLSKHEISMLLASHGALHFFSKAVQLFASLPVLRMCHSPLDNKGH